MHRFHLLMGVSGWKTGQIQLFYLSNWVFLGLRHFRFSPYYCQLHLRIKHCHLAHCSTRFAFERRWHPDSPSRSLSSLIISQCKYYEWIMVLWLKFEGFREGINIKNSLIRCMFLRIAPVCSSLVSCGLLSEHPEWHPSEASCPRLISQSDSAHARIANKRKDLMLFWLRDSHPHLSLEDKSGVAK